MDFNTFEEPSPFAQFWQPGEGRGSLEGDDAASSSLSSLASQALQTENDEEQHHSPEDEVVDGGVLPTTITTSQSSRTLLSITKSVPESEGNVLQLDRESVSTKETSSQTALNVSSGFSLSHLLNAPAGQDKTDTTAGATGTGTHDVTDEMNAPTSNEVGDIEGKSAQQQTSPIDAAAQSTNGVGSNEERAHTEPQEAQSTSNQSDRAKSVPVTSAAVKAQSTIIRLPSVSSPARDFGPGEKGEEESALEAQIHEEVMAHSPRDSYPSGELQEPQPLPSARKRRRSAFEMLQAETDKHLGSDYNDSDKRRASAPVSVPQKTLGKKSGSGSLMPLQVATLTPGKRGRPRKSEASGVTVASGTKQHKVTKTPVQRKSMRTISAAEELQSKRILSSKKLQNDGGNEASKIEATPVSARRGRPPKASIAKLAEMAATTDTPKRRGRPPKHAATPASQKRGSRRESNPITESGQDFAVGVGSILRNVPSPKTSARILKQLEESSSRPDTPASEVKRREPQANPNSGQRSRRSLNTTEAEVASGAEPTTEHTEKRAEAEPTAHADNETNEAPAKRRGRQPKPKAVEESTSHPVEEPSVAPKKRGRQPKSAPVEKLISLPIANDASSAPAKRRGRPPKSTATVKDNPESTAKEVGSGPAKRRGRPANSTVEKQSVSESAEEPAPKKRGRPANPVEQVASKKRGRPSKNQAQTLEEPKTKKRRISDEDESKAEEAGIVALENTSSSGRRGRVVKFDVPQTITAPESTSRGRGRKAAIVEGSSSTDDAPPSSRPRGRPGRKPKGSEDAKTPVVEPMETNTETKPKERRGRPAGTQRTEGMVGPLQTAVMIKSPAKNAGGAATTNLRRSGRSKA
ncbi:hypothetical protein PT974_02049 [Cladobotryum mycophilum]|uniref:AT hook domain-containing protein n=1 Tax=Cladobotryum mycophilum TaxID=491253 RepID=A0ABR0SXH2_9HYPO